MQGFRHRRRRVLWEPADPSSKACPHLLESAQCEEPSCYLWRVRPLEDCVPGESACGPGTARQNVTCVDTEEIDVADRTNSVPVQYGSINVFTPARGYLAV
ncbi:unnamed protein product [Arctogadus glacialis]